MLPNQKDEIAGLFGLNPLVSFEQSAAASLVANRNRQLGALLLSERAIFYVQILYRMLFFKADYHRTRYLCACLPQPGFFPAPRNFAAY